MAIYSSPLKIGNLQVRSRILQSPLSGVTDLVFRRLVRRFAPDSMLYTEMVNATEISQLQELPQLMVIGDKEQPISMQLFDCRPDFMAVAAEKAVKEGAMTIDINMGCPVNKITRCATKNDRIRVPEDTLSLLISESLVNQDQKISCTWGELGIGTMIERHRRRLANGEERLYTYGVGVDGERRSLSIRSLEGSVSVPCYR